jgi:hypothetical protein
VHRTHSVDRTAQTMPATALPSLPDDGSIMRPDPNLVCPICLDVFNVPVRTQCGHIFCRGCLGSWMANRSQCPECRAEVSLEEVCVDRLADRLVENTNVTCQLRSSGCCWVGRRGDRIAHLASECQHVSVFCPNGGCEREVLRSELSSHLESCECGPSGVCDDCDDSGDVATISCPFGCSELCTPTQLAEHQRSCLLEPRKLLEVIGRMQQTQEALAAERSQLKRELAESLVGKKRPIEQITPEPELGRVPSTETI